MPIRSPTLSVLTPALPSRLAGGLVPLYEELARQAAESGAGRVELLALLDNKAMTVGEKRQALARSARGAFVAFIDDDDRPEPGYVAKLLAAADAPAAGRAGVIVFDQWCEYEEAPRVLVRFGLECEDTQLDLSIAPPGYAAHRRPWMCCAWARSVVRRCAYPATNYGEDADWVAQAVRHCRMMGLGQRRIEGEPLHTYRYRAAVSEALPDLLDFPPIPPPPLPVGALGAPTPLPGLAEAPDAADAIVGGLAGQRGDPAPGGNTPLPESAADSPPGAKP